MRVLLLMRGSAGCGKSTYIEQNGLKPYTLCADDFRMMCASPTLTPQGNFNISSAHDRVVWDMLFQVLEIRMRNGEFTVIDATNSKTSEMQRYKELAQNYRYRIYCIDMTDIPMEEVKRRNSQRDALKRVPDSAIEKFYARFETQKIPSGIKVLKPDELSQIWYQPFDLSSYKKVHVIGDIHGCHTALMEYFTSNGGIHDDEFYIFSGDYVDRGIENAQVVQFIIDNYQRKNCIFLEGNHERWLWHYANDIIAKSKEFEFVTKPQLVKARIPLKAIREIYRRFAQCAYFTYENRFYLVTHGGISAMPDNMILIPTSHMISGVGRYNEVDECDQSFCVHSPDYTYQIHGHRNVANTPIQSADRCYNLEGDVEFGGCLRAVQITQDGITPVETKNLVFKDPSSIAQEIVDTQHLNVDSSVYQLVHSMRKNRRSIIEKQFGDISSFNFSRDVFENKDWNDLTTKARGLFIDTKKYEVIARGYEKFFNVNERPFTQLSNLKYKLQFPVTAYVKENGFLGIVGWNHETDDLLIASKSTIVGNFVSLIENNLLSVYGEDVMNRMKQYLKENNVSFVFEVCDPVNDPHIIEYEKPKVVLLDVIENQIEFKKLPYEELSALAAQLGLEVKHRAITIDSWELFYSWYLSVTQDDYLYHGNPIEGFVIEDSAGFMVKLKLSYYHFWKHMRSVAHAVIKYGKYNRMGSLMDEFSNTFYGWCVNRFADLSNAERQAITAHNGICAIRNEFLKWRETNGTNVQSV